MQLEVEDAPLSLMSRHIARIKVLLDLIITGAKLHGDAVMALVDILVDVLDGADGGYALHIDVAPVLPQQVWAVADHPAIVHLFVIDNVGLASVPAAHVGIGIFSDSGGVPEWLGEALGTATILLAWRCGQGIIARGVDHVLLDQLKQLWLSILIRHLSRQQGIHIIWSAQLVVRVEKENHVHVRKATLLELNGVNPSHHYTKTASLDVSNQAIHLGMEDANHQVRAISCSLTFKELPLDFRPVGISSGSEEEVSTSKVAIDGKGILAALLHVASATYK
jgi:hypothetical protein